MRFRLIIIGLLLCPSIEGLATCKKIDSNELTAWLSQHQSTKEIVFFASWCGSCKEHIADASENTILVAVFDTQQNAIAVNKAINTKNRPCFWDRDQSVAKSFKIKSLPFSASTKALTAKRDL